MRLRRRHYLGAGVVVADGQYGIALDGRALRTPGGHLLRLRAPLLAQAISAEWLAQGEVIAPDTMPMTQLAVTAIDRVAPHRRQVVRELAGYGASDLLCYRADQPDDLVARQARIWQPLLDWAATTWNVRLRVGSGIMPVEQSHATLARLEAVVADRDDLRLTALANVVQASGSLIIGLALACRRLSAEAAFVAAEVEADHQIARWGEIPEISERRRRLRGELDAAARFLELLDGVDGDGPARRANDAIGANRVNGGDGGGHGAEW